MVLQLQNYATNGLFLKMLSDVVNNEVVNNTKFNKLKAKINTSEKKISDATSLIHMSQYNIHK